MTKHEPHVYLDYAATAPILPAAFKEMGRVAGLGLGNPSSLHNRGLGARRIIDEARQTLARSLGAEPWQIIFTSGGTESNNLAIGGTALRKRRGHLICSAVEHPSVGECCRRLTDLGYTMDTVPVDRTGRVEPERVLEAIRPDTVLVSIMHANNEIGTIQPVAQIAALVKQANPRILIHTDAVQTFTHIPVHPSALGVDFLTLSSHKIHGPPGTGALFVRNKDLLTPIFGGGGQEYNLRSGTENYPAIAGFGVAVREGMRGLRQQGEADHHQPNRAATTGALREKLIRGVLSRVPGATLNGPALGAEENRALPHIVNFTFPGVESEVLLHSLEARGLFVSAGAACGANNKGLSPTLRAIGLTKQTGEGHIRFSLSRFTTGEQIQYALEALTEAINELRS